MSRQQQEGSDGGGESHRRTVRDTQEADEREPTTDSWLDEPLFSPDGDVPAADSSFWERMWTAPQRLSPVRQRRSILRMVDSGASSPSSFLIWIGACLYLVLVVAGLWPLGFNSLKHLLHDTDSTYHPLPGTPSGQAQDAFAKRYNDSDWNDPMHPPMVMVLQGDDSLLYPQPRLNETKAFVEGLERTLNETCWKTPWEKECSTEDVFNVRVLSYFSWKALQLDAVAKTMTAHNDSVLFLEIQYMVSSNVSHTRERTDQLLDILWDYTTSTSVTFTVQHTGIKWFQRDLSYDTKTDLRRMDLYILPLALVLLGLVLRRANPLFVWIFPLVSMISTVCCWSTLLRFTILRWKWQVTQITPSIMMSLTVGMGLDYSLFLLSRYVEDESNETRLTVMIKQGGQVVLMSGLTLLCTFLGLVLLPLNMLQSIGLGSAVAIGSAMFMNVTVNAALLYATPLGRWILLKNRRDADEPAATQSSSEPLLSVQDNGGDDANIIPKTSFWLRLARCLLHPIYSLLILGLILIGLLPVAYFSTKMETSLDFHLLLPQSSPSLEAYEDLLHQDPAFAGTAAPFRLLFDGGDERMDTASGFDVMHKVVTQLMKLDVSPPPSRDKAISSTLRAWSGGDKSRDDNGFTKWTESSLIETHRLDQEMVLDAAGKAHFNGISVVENHIISYSLYDSAMNCKVEPPFPYCKVEWMHALKVLDDQVTSSDRMATYISITLPVNPFSKEGLDWLARARSILDQLQSKEDLMGVEVYLQGSAAMAEDTVEVVLRSLPRMVVTTLVVVFLLMGFFFRSALVVPLRSVVSISLTMAFSFGATVLVFQKDLLGLSPTDSEISWLVPVLAFPIIVGLALDYDVFLTSRVVEFYVTGWAGQSSVVAGLHFTGNIVTAAGGIMAVAFGGLQWTSRTPVLIQWSFAITTAVLLDTFIMRTTVVPILMGWMGVREDCYDSGGDEAPARRRVVEGFDLSLDGDSGEDLAGEENAAEEGRQIASPSESVVDV